MLHTGPAPGTSKASILATVTTSVFVVKIHSLTQNVCKLLLKVKNQNCFVSPTKTFSFYFCETWNVKSKKYGVQCRQMGEKNEKKRVGGGGIGLPGATENIKLPLVYTLNICQSNFLYLGVRHAKKMRRHTLCQKISRLMTRITDQITISIKFQNWLTTLKENKPFWRLGHRSVCRY